MVHVSLNSLKIIHGKIRYILKVVFFCQQLVMTDVPLLQKKSWLQLVPILPLIIRKPIDRIRHKSNHLTTWLFSNLSTEALTEIMLSVIRVIMYRFKSVLYNIVACIAITAIYVASDSTFTKFGQISNTIFLNFKQNNL